MSDNSFHEFLESNLMGAIAALHSERYYEFTDGLLRLLDNAKHSDRLLQSLLMGATGTPRERTEARLAQATEDNDWF